MPTSGAHVVELTDEQIQDRIRRAVATLRDVAGTDDLTDIVTRGLDYQLPGTPGVDAAFAELSAMTWMATGVSLPCCSTHDEDRIDAVIAYAASLCG